MKIDERTKRLPHGTDMAEVFKGISRFEIIAYEDAATGDLTRAEVFPAGWATPLFEITPRPGIAPQDVLEFIASANALARCGKFVYDKIMAKRVRAKLWREMRKRTPKNRGHK